jgi:arylsulfatase A-like enzyme
MWANTLIVMTSDNGGPSGVDGGNANNWPLRGGKKTEFEGEPHTRQSSAFRIA